MNYGPCGNGENKVCRAVLSKFVANLSSRKILLLAKQFFIFLCILSRENELRDRAPYTTLFPRKIFYVNLFLVLCHTAWLFSGRHLIGWLEWRQVILKLVGNSFHCRSLTASDMTCKLSSPSQKISTEK